MTEPQTLRRIDDADRAELCRLVDFPAMLQSFGVEVRRRGAALVCAIRRESTPSCYIYPPGQGVLGHRGWTYHDYGGGGSGAKGDAVGYLIDCQGMAYMDAMRYLADLTGFRPAGLGSDPFGADKPITPKPRPLPPARPQIPVMPPDEQAEACRIYLDALCEVYPGAEIEGAAYLGPSKAHRGRNVLPKGWPSVGYHQPPEIEGELTKALLPNAELMTRAGFLKAEGERGPVRLQWGAFYGQMILLAHHDERGRVAFFAVRRFDWHDGDRLPKYLRQTTERGAQRIPFGLASIYRPAPMTWRPAPEHAKELLIVEGELDALGAACLGWPALGMGGRVQSSGAKDMHSRTFKMLEPHLPALRDLHRIAVMPDNDADPAKAAEGVALAGKLVALLRVEGCRAETITLDRLGVPVPPGCKDVAELAASA